MKKQDCVLLLFNIVGNFGVCIYIYIPFFRKKKKNQLNLNFNKIVKFMN